MGCVRCIVSQKQKGKKRWETSFPEDISISRLLPAMSQKAALEKMRNRRLGAEEKNILLLSVVGRVIVMISTRAPEDAWKIGWSGLAA